MNTLGINVSAKAKAQPQQNQWVEEAKETPSPKRAKKLKGETIIRKTRPQSTQKPRVPREASVGKIIREEKMRNILRDFSNQLAYFWGT